MYLMNIFAVRFFYLKTGKDYAGERKKYPEFISPFL